jgi:Flp pilus assembly protein CpaB
MVGEALAARPRPAKVAGPRRAWRSRVSGGHLVMLLAGLVGAVLTIAALQSADHRVDVLVARNDLAPGDTVRAADLRTVRVNGDPGAMSALVRADDLGDLVGKVVTVRVDKGRFVARDDFERAGAAHARRSMSFPIDRSRALDGELVAGDTVDVVAADARTGEARYVATGAEVLRVAGTSRGALGGDDTMTVTLAVDPDTALAIAIALHGNELTLVRATGAAAIEDAA